MLRLLFTLVLLGLTVHSAMDCAQSPARDVRGLPKGGWLFVIIVLPVFGPLAWLVAGRPQPGRHNRAVRSDDFTTDASHHAHSSWPLRVIGPDDDPAFLAELGRRRQEELRRRQGSDGPE